MTIFRSENIYRAMSALTSLIHLSTAECISPFFVAVSEIHPFISHAEALVDALADSDPNKKYFRALVGLARATSYLYEHEQVPIGFSFGIRSRLIELLREYRCVFPLCSEKES